MSNQHGNREHCENLVDLATRLGKSQRRWWQRAPRRPTPAEALQAAQVHADLAIAEQLERLNDKLDGADTGGQFASFLDGLHHSITEIVWRNTGGGR